MVDEPIVAEPVDAPPVAQPEPEQHDKLSNAEAARLRIAEKKAKEAEEARQKAEAEKAELEKQLAEIRANSTTREEMDAQVKKLLFLNRNGVSLEIRDFIKSTDEAGMLAELEVLRKAFPGSVAPAPQDPTPGAPPAPQPPPTVTPPPPPRREPEVVIEHLPAAQQKQAYLDEWNKLHRDKASQ